VINEGIMGNIKQDYTFELLENIINSLATPIFIKNDEHKWILVNDAYCKMLGHPREKWLGKSDFDFFSDQEAEVFWKKDIEVFKSGKINTNEEFVTGKDGVTHCIKTTKTVFNDKTIGRVLCGVFTDITSLKNTQHQLEKLNIELTKKVAERTSELEKINQYLKELAFKDLLTGLYNRSGLDKMFKKYLKRAQSKNEKFAVLYLDVDNLKFVNDKYGHPMGDILIKKVAQTATKIIQKKGTIARVGGDEFIILMRYKHKNKITVLANEIVVQMRSIVISKKDQIPTSSSMGIACYPKNGSNQWALTKNADKAMYQSKQKYQGSYQYYQHNQDDS